jgi:hypothetical protein
MSLSLYVSLGFACRVSQFVCHMCCISQFVCVTPLLHISVCTCCVLLPRRISRFVHVVRLSTVSRLLVGTCCSSHLSRDSHPCVHIRGSASVSDSSIFDLCPCRSIRADLSTHPYRIHICIRIRLCACCVHLVRACRVVVLHLLACAFPHRGLCALHQISQTTAILTEI